MMILLTYWYYFALAVVVLAALVVMVSLYLRANMEAPEMPEDDVKPTAEDWAAVYRDFQLVGDDIRYGTEEFKRQMEQEAKERMRKRLEAYYSLRDDPEAQQERRMHTRL